MAISIPINRNRFPIVFLVSLLITIAFSFNLIYTKTEGLYMNGLFNYVFNSIILIVPLFYTIVSFADFMKTKFDKEASFEISENGLYDNLSVFSCGKIKWGDIKSVELTKYLNADFLIIKVYENNKLLMGKNVIQRYVLKRYIKRWGSPIVISEKRVDYKLDDIRQAILTNKPK